MAAACEEGGGERFRSWYLSREEIERGSPSRRDGVSAAKEDELRATYCSFIRDVCLRLRLPQITIATAILLCHRFYLRQSHAKNEWQTVATVCVFLASKIEDTPCFFKHVVIVAYETMYRKTPDVAKRVHQQEVLAKQKALILVGETLLLSTIRFDFNIHHPYEPLKLALKNLGVSQMEVRKVAINLINDTLPTTLVVQFKPHYIAAGSLFLAAKFHNFILPSENGRVWWHEFDVAPKQLEAVIQQMTLLFKKREPCVMGPAIKPSPLPTLMDRQQITSTTVSALTHKQLSRSISTSNTRGSRCVPVVSSFDNKSTDRSARIEDPCSMGPALKPTLMDKQQVKRNPDSDMRHTQSSRSTRGSRCVPTVSSFDNKSAGRSPRNEENRYRQTHTNHNLNVVAVDQKLEEQSSRETTKADRVYHVCSGSKDMNASRIRDLTRQRRVIHEVGGLPTPVYISDTDAWRIGRQISSVIVVETNPSWKKQKVERR